MAKRVVLIGHPVAHSLSGVLQQAAFDALGIDAVYEPLDRPLIELPEAIAALRGRRLPGRQHHRAVQGAGRADGRPPHRGGARDGRRRHHHPRGRASSSATTPTCWASGRRSMRSWASSGCPRRPSCSAPAVARGRPSTALITAGFQHVIVFNRHLHRAEALVKHFARSAAHMELQRQAVARVGARGRAVADQGAGQRQLRGPRPDETPIPPELLPPDLLVLDLLYTPKETRLLREAAAAGAGATGTAT